MKSIHIRFEQIRDLLTQTSTLPMISSPTLPDHCLLIPPLGIWILPDFCPMDPSSERSSHLSHSMTPLCVIARFRCCLHSKYRYSAPMIRSHRIYLSSLSQQLLIRSSTANCIRSTTVDIRPFLLTTDPPRYLRFLLHRCLPILLSHTLSRRFRMHPILILSSRIRHCHLMMLLNRSRWTHWCPSSHCRYSTRGCRSLLIDPHLMSTELLTR